MNRSAQDPGKTTARVASFFPEIQIQNLVDVMKRFGSIPIALACLHCFWTAPMLVQCLPANGAFLIEVVGTDPCHTLRCLRSTPSLEFQQPSPQTRHYEPIDPCVDRALDSLGGFLNCQDIFMPASKAFLQFIPEDDLELSDTLIGEESRIGTSSSVCDPQSPAIRALRI